MVYLSAPGTDHGMRHSARIDMKHEPFFQSWHQDMSRAFVKEPDGEAPEALPERPVSQHPNLVTTEGLAATERELARLDAAYVAALQAGDKAAAAVAQRDLRYWTARRASAQLVAPSTETSRGHFGAIVTIERDDGRLHAFRIVGEDEADPAQGTLSYVSPLARALLGKTVGDVVAAGDGEAEILEIE